MAKLHELLAVSSNMAGQAQKTRTDLQATFASKRHLFEEKRVTFTPNTEGAEPKTEAQSDIQTSVTKEIEWISGILAKAADAAYAIDQANTMARADIVLESGEVLAKDVPATFLLQLEKRVKESQELIRSIPTLDPAKGFSVDADKGKGVYRAREVHKTRTAKVQEPLQLAAATDKHPAQVQLIVKDVATGTILEQEWSALITPSTKTALLENSEILLRAVSKARARANEQEIDQASNKIGKRLLDFIFQPLHA